MSRLKIGQLETVVKHTLAENKFTQSILNEIDQYFAGNVWTKGGLERVIVEANERLDVLEKTGKLPKQRFKTSLLLKLMESKSANCKKFASRLLPESLLKKFVNDRTHEVRIVLAKRLPLKEAKNLQTLWNNDQVEHIIKDRELIAESDAYKPLELYSGKLGDIVKQSVDADLGDEFYHTLALKMVYEFDREIEQGWEEKVVKNYCAHMKVTTGVEIDAEKLLDEIFSIIDEKEEQSLEEQLIFKQINIVVENCDVDPAKELLTIDANSKFANQFNKLYKAKGKQIGEGILPSKCTLPTNTLRYVDEQNLDRYVSIWNRRQLIESAEPLKMNWTVGNDDQIQFTVRIL